VHAVIIIGALSLLVGLLIFVKKESTKGILLTKPSLSVLFVIVALTGSSANPIYFYFVLAGLLFRVAGDVLLIFPAKKFFLAGLVSLVSPYTMRGNSRSLTLFISSDGLLLRNWDYKQLLTTAS